MKCCSSCRIPQPLSEFNVKRRNRDGLQSECRSCNRKSSRQYYARNRTHHRAVIRQANDIRRKRNQDYILDYLRTHSCVDCGFEHPAALQFDHVKGVKKKEVAILVHHGYALSTINEEIAKCEVRCANCHSIKTAQDFNWFSAGL